MTIDLDLNEHLASLKIEVRAAMEARHPYSLGGEVDVQTGWATVVVRDLHILEPRLGAIVGDIIHNLRSALDYIVTALVDTTPSISIGRKHQFPIYDDAAEYAKNVWNTGETMGRGPLGGIRHGLAIFEPLQPYHTNPDHSADPLLQLHRFSNADKHRQIIGHYPQLEPGDFHIVSEGTVVEHEVPSEYVWVNGEVVMGRVRFAAPFPRHVHAQSEMTVRPLYAIPAFGKHPKGIGLDVSNLQVMCEHVRMVTDLFKSI